MDTYATSQQANENGHNLVVLNGYNFREDRETQRGMAWRCTVKTCKTRVHLNETDSQIFNNGINHNHKMGSIPTLSILRGDTWLSQEDMSIHRLVESSAKVNSCQAALLFQDRCLSYSEMDSAANKLARALLRSAHSLGACHPNQDGDFLVAVSMEPSDRLIITLLAIWKTGAAYLPLDPGFPAPRVAHILGEASPNLLVCDKENPELYGEYRNVLVYDDLLKEAADLSPESIPEKETFSAGSSNLALVLYTSGSTGIPKGVRLFHNAVMNRLHWQWRVFPYAEDERTCVFKTALTFVDSVCEIWGPLCKGRCVVVVPREVTKDPERLIRVLQEHKVQRLVLVPSLLRSLLLYLGLEPTCTPLNELKVWVCSGEPLPVQLAHEFFQYFDSGNHVLCNFYGSTEVMGDVTYHVIRSSAEIGDSTKIPIGRPLDNTAVYLLDEHFRPVLQGEVGELLVAGLNLAAGYVNGRDPERFVPNPLTIDPEYSRLYRTGDYARLDKGVLMYEGRTDSQVKIRGHRVDLNEVEQAVSSIPEVDKSVVLCYKPGEIEQALVTFVVQKPGAELTAQQLELLLQKKLASYMLPQVLLLDGIPLLVNGKIDRQQLLRQYDEISHRESRCHTANVQLDLMGVPIKKHEAARVLLNTVAEVLGSGARTSISLEANFYELGGNSLNSVYTVTKLREKGYVIGITDFISAKDLRVVLERLRIREGNVHDQEEEATRHYTSEMLQHHHKEHTIRMITDSFYEKADLEQWLKPDIDRKDYEEFMLSIWEPLVEKDLSFIVKDKETSQIVGVALSFDVHDEPEVEIPSKLSIVFEFLEHLEGPIRDGQLPQEKGKVLHSFMMATDSSLTSQQNVEVMQYMEYETLKLARAKNFTSIFTTNTNPLTQQLGTDVYGYKVLLDYQVNQFVMTDGSKPFANAPDSQRALCSWKPI